MEFGPQGKKFQINICVEVITLFVCVGAGWSEGDCMSLNE